MYYRVDGIIESFGEKHEIAQVKGQIQAQVKVRSPESKTIK